MTIISVPTLSKIAIEVCAIWIAGAIQSVLESNLRGFLMASGDDIDSGVESIPTSSKDMTPEKPKALPEIEDDDDLELDETLAERLWGLTEMFPEPVRDFTYKLTVNTISGIKGFYGLSRVAVWAIASSSVILFAPVVFEVERYQMKQMQENRDKQVLLGPSSAMNMAGGPPAPLAR